MILEEVEVSQPGRPELKDEVRGPSVRMIRILRTGESVDVRPVLSDHQEPEEVTLDESCFALGPEPLSREWRTRGPFRRRWDISDVEETPLFPISHIGILPDQSPPRGSVSATLASLRRMRDPRERLLRRLETEARAFANSDASSARLRLGRVYGLLEAGVIAGYWRKKDSAAAAGLIQHRYRLSRLRDVLLRGDEVTLWRVSDIAEFLDISHQRVDQLLHAGRLPSPSGRSGRTRLWERRDIEGWAEADWWDSRRWRKRA